MKYKLMQTILLSSMVLFFCFNGTLIDSTPKSNLPDVNFHGTIETHNDKTFNAEYILIGKPGRYQDIPAYPYSSIKKLKKNLSKQKNTANETNKITEIDPTQNKSLLRLDEIKSIELKHPNNPTESIIKINDKDYIEITVKSINDNSNDYLIESSRIITCKEIENGPKKIQTDRELHMIHIKKLTIDSWKTTKDSDEKKPIKSSSEPSSLKDKKQEISKNTENLIDQIEKNVKDLSQESPSTFEKMKSTILSLLKSLREQLQKMLDMLQ